MGTVEDLKFEIYEDIDPKESCKHHSPSWNALKTTMSVDRFDNRFANVKSVCMDCGADIVAEWKTNNTNLEYK